MKRKLFALPAATAFLIFAVATAHAESNAAPLDNGGMVTAKVGGEIAKIVPGQSTKADVRALFGAPWRTVQFNDCGMAMDDQADETWEYRGAGPSGGFRLHIEFGDNDVVHLIAKIPDDMPGGAATRAKLAPEPAKDMPKGDMPKGMSM
jgi:hypothetical protein